jgi:hypothetical protein
MAVHYILIYKDDKGTFPVELQLKTKRMKAINEISHGAYAAHNLDKSRLLECTSIANRADKGDENAIAQYNDLMKDKDALKDSFYLNKTKKYKDGGDVGNSIKEGQIYLNTTTDNKIIIDKVEDSNNAYPSVHYHIADEPKSYRNSNIDRISLFENLVDSGAFVLQNNTYRDGGAVNEEWSEINNMYNNGGGLESFTTVEEYFKNLPFDKLPKEFSDYVKTEILTDSDLKHLSQNEPIFVQIKDKVDGYLKPVETTESVAPNKNLALRIKLLKKNLEKDPSNISIKTRIKLLSKNLLK